MKMETELTVISLNCWGIVAVSKDRVLRMEAIANELATGKYDFAFLQEVWSTEDFERIKNRAKEALPYSHYFYSGVIGAGICIFSKSPITAAFFHQWAVNGYVHKIQHGDWFGGKGIGMVQVLHKGLNINLYTTHLHAEYDRVNDEYLAHRVTQAFDTAQFITLTSQRADLVIAGGDLNTEPGDLAYRVIMHSAELRDSFFERPVGSEEQYTCESAANSYTPPAVLKSNPFGKRIDYVMYKSGDSVNVTTQSCCTPLPRRVPGENFSFSDHDAVVAKLKILKSESVTPHECPEGSKREALEESVEICSQALIGLNFRKYVYHFFGIVCMVLLIASSAFQFDNYLCYLLTFGRLILVLSIVFCIFMGVIWNRMEVHGILAGKLAMELELQKPRNGVPDYDPATDDRWLKLQMANNAPPHITMPRFE